MNNIYELLGRHARQGNYENVRECLKSEIQDMLLIVTTNAIQHSKFNIIENLLEEEGLLLYFEFILPNIIEVASASGKLEVLKFLHSKYYTDEICAAMKFAVIHNQPHIVHWLVKNNYYPLPSDVDNAATNGYTPLVEWFHNKGYNGTV